MLVVSSLMYCIFYFLLYLYLFNKFVFDRNLKIDIRILILAFLIAVLYYLLTKYNFIYIRPYFIHIYIFISLIFLYKQKIIKTLIVLLCVFLLLCISEFLYDSSLIFIFKINIQNFVSVWYGFIFSNIVIWILILLISMLPFVKRIINNIISWYNRNEFKSLAIFVIACMIFFTFLLYNNFFEFLPRSILGITNIFCVIVMFFIISYFREKANNNRIITEYDQLLKYVNKYEKVVEDKSKRQHEYKNQLVLIKGMINKTNKKAIEYIDSLYEEEKDDSNLEMLKKLQYLPSGGLKGLIYYKLEDMKDKKINVFVDISPKAKNVKVNKKIDSNLKDISKVIGVYLDNAIEASVHSKEKYIVLEIYLDKDEWVFSLSNTYKGEINLNRIDKEGYTTKGSGKGYGLSLVKDIIEHNSNLRQERELRGIYYTQRLYMKK